MSDDDVLDLAMSMMRESPESTDRYRVASALYCELMDQRQGVSQRITPITSEMLGHLCSRIDCGAYVFDIKNKFFATEVVLTSSGDGEWFAKIIQDVAMMDRTDFESRDRSEIRIGRIGTMGQLLDFISVLQGAVR